MSTALLFGRHGFAVITSGGVSGPAGPYYALVCDVETQYAAAAVAGFGASLPDETRAAESVRVGRFASVTVTGAGRVLAYPEDAEGHDIT